MIKATNETVKFFKLILYLRVGSIDLHKTTDWRERTSSFASATPIPQMRLHADEHQVIREAYIHT